MQNILSEKFTIPYDCEFIIIQRQNNTMFKFTEIYKIKDNAFSLDFGFRNEIIGLKISNDSFYRRRFNFQKSEARILSSNPEVRNNNNEVKLTTGRT